MACRIDTIVLDKTGTITRGKPRVTGVFPAPGRTESELLRLAASAERYSEHPLGKAIVEAAAERGLALEEATEFSALAGHGVRARVAGHEVAIGRPGASVEIDGAPAAPSKSPTPSSRKPRKPCAVCARRAWKSG